MAHPSIELSFALHPCVIHCIVRTYLLFNTDSIIEYLNSYVHLMMIIMYLYVVHVHMYVCTARYCHASNECK